MGCCCVGGRAPDRCTIVLLDETEIDETVESSERGEALLHRVCKRLDLLETAYFGLRYLAKDGQSRWIEPAVKVSDQLKGVPLPHTLYFGIKFYASDPCKLVEEVTRYQFVLQLKQDVLQGRLPVNEDLAAELFALSLQSELGDYDSRRHPPLYASEFRFIPAQTQRLEEKAEKLHKGMRGQVPSVVEMKFLEKVKWLDLYGVDLHAVTGDSDVRYFLGLTPSGILVVKDGQRVNNFFWPRIIRVFFKGKQLCIRVRDKANDETTFTFLLPSRQSSEYLWRCCVEHHAFFRLTQVKENSVNPMHQLFRLGSSHRYSGRTEHQALVEGRRSARTTQKFDRVPSRRRNRRTPIGAEKEKTENEKNGKVSEPNGSCKSGDERQVMDDLDILHQRLAAEMSGPLYRSASTPAVLADVEQRQKSELPPWEDPEHRGLFSSRNSLASSRGSERRSSHRHRRSGSLDSDDSRRRRHRARRGFSDNDSDVSRSSRGSRNGRNHSHRRHRSHSRGGSGSDSDSQHKSRRRKHRQNGSNYNLVDSETQWKMVQKQQHEQNGSAPRYQSAVVRNLSSKKSGYVNSGIDTESEAPAQQKKKHRRRSRSRSRSPESGPILSQDVKKHIEYKLVDPIHLTEEEKKDIKYTRVESEASVYRIKCSPSAGRQKYKVSRVSSTRSSLEKKPSKPNDPVDNSKPQRR